MQSRRSPLKKLQQSWQTAFNTENREFTLDVLKVLISAFGVLATVLAGLGLYLTYLNSQAERQLNSERLVTDRFAKAVEQLGNGTIDVRIGAIYSLERIAKDSPRDHWTIMEVLTAFVRNKSQLPKDWKQNSKQELPEVAIDVQSALTVIGRREVKNDPMSKELDLSRTNLSRANLELAYLNNANLSNTNLKGANLFEAKLEEINFSGADLRNATLKILSITSAGVNLNGSNFSGADLRGIDLKSADLSKANLEGANLEGVNFINQESLGLSDNGAELSGANLRGANLRDVNLSGSNLNEADLRGAIGINPNQVKAAENWEKAHYSPDFRQQLGLPPESPKL